MYCVLDECTSGVYRRTGLERRQVLSAQLPLADTHQALAGRRRYAGRHGLKPAVHPMSDLGFEPPISEQHPKL